MASTRESSPARESTPDSPAQLSPNSKVKALLAQFDDDSDEDNDVGSPRARVLTSLKDPNTTATTSATADLNTKLSGEEAKAPSPTAREESEDDDEDEDIFRPKGRLASRMEADDSNSVEDQAATSGARERAKEIPTTNKLPERTIDAEDEDASEENEGPVVARRRKVRTSRQDTPKLTPARKPASPGLFVSPEKIRSTTPAGDASDSDSLPENLGTNARFLALVAEKRKERQAKAAEEAKEKARKAAEQKKFASILDNDLDDSDAEGERRLTQASRPSRKASKRALEEMHRETQRLSRNQQLAHNAVTKKKITKESLFAKFNFRPTKEDTEEQSRPTSSSSAAPQSDVEMRDTPATSPVSRGASEKPIIAFDMSQIEAGAELAAEEFPDLEDLAKLRSPPPTKLDKGKGKEIREPTPELKAQKKPLFIQRPIRIRPPKKEDRISVGDDSDSDLEIITMKTPVKRKIDAVFDRVPAHKEKESSAIYALKMFANLKSPGKQNLGRNKKPTITTSELQVSLQQRARQQAAREREERLQELRAKGVIVQTAEEREKEMAEFDDLLSRARREDEELTKQEKAAGKKERKANGEEDPLGDSSDDEDWEEEKDNLAEELSGSGSGEEDMEGSEQDDSEAIDEEEEEMAVDDEQADAPSLNPMFDDEAADSDVDEAKPHLSVNEEMAEDGDIDEEDELPTNKISRRVRKINVISDDEDDDHQNTQTQIPTQTPLIRHTVSPMQPRTVSPIVPNSVLRSATKTFIPGLAVTGPAGLGLTQIFAGTMDESQNDPFETQTGSNMESQRKSGERNSLAFLRRAPAPTLPPFVPTMSEDTQETENNNESQLSHIPESQPVDSETQGIQLNFTQSQVHEFDSMVEDPYTQMSQFPEPTQDLGFQHMTPIKGRFLEAPPSTVDTVMLDLTTVPETTEETPIVKKKGRLHRRAQVVTFSDDEDANEPAGPNVEEDDFKITENVFDIMRKTSKKKVVDEFDKEKSKAKEMVHEQAEESEDEYAGLGGASDDESGDEADAYVKEMIDDEAGKDADERQLAAFFADRERASDEKQVEKLYKDITNGMLRRKRGADYDLSDSDDGGEARQRMKRKEFAKMRKALLADERIGKIAENPKRQAFLRAIEDRNSEDETDFLGDFEEPEKTDSQSQSQGEEPQQVVLDSQPSMGPPKRKGPGDATEPENRPPPHLRRTKPNKKPSNISEIRESLSSLIEEPNAVQVADSGSESEDDLEIEDGKDLSSGKQKEKENRDPFALRRTHAAVIDRISLKRQSSSMVSNSTKLAFATSLPVSGFKVPPLLRRATTNSSIVSSTNSSVSGGMSATERMAGGSGSDGVRRGGGKNSGVNYFARESERRAAVVKTEKRREAKLVKGAQVRRKVVGGLFGGGKFE